jgi:hypothetical protein
MRIRVEIPIDENGPKSVQELLSCLTRIWARHHATRPLPSLYGSGIVYQTEPNVGEYEVWKRPMETFEDGWGDCDDLTLYRCVELICGGRGATPQTIAQRSALGVKMHVRVEHPNGTVEDPSLILPWRKFETL